MESLNELLQQLMSKPEEITRIQEDILSLTETQLSVQKEINEISASIKSEINYTVDTNGKKVYTNAESRDSAFVEMSNNNQDYLDREEELNQIDARIKSLRIQLEEENNIQRNIRAVLPIYYNGDK